LLNELLLGLIVNSSHTDTPDEIEPPTKKDINIHLSLAEQQCLDGYAAIVDHAIKRKDVFDTKL
jgi:hypothetical protein